MQILINGLKTNRAFAVSSFFVLLLIAVALAAPLIAPYDPLEAVMQNAYLPPSAEHLFGTDKLGRDNFSRILYGASYSLSSVLLLVTIIFAVGTTLGGGLLRRQGGYRHYAHFRYDDFFSGHDSGHSRCRYFGRQPY